MEKLDVAIAVAGVAILAVAIAGSAFTGVGAGAAYTLTFPTKEEALPQKTGSTQGSGSLTFTFDVTGLNVSAVTFRASASTAPVPHPGADAFKLTLIAPDGTETSADAAEISREVAEAPDDMEVRAASQEEAARLGPAAASAGAGTWTLTVDLTHTDAVPIAHSVTASGSVARWSAIAQVPTPPAR